MVTLETNKASKIFIIYQKGFGCFAIIFSWYFQKLEKLTFSVAFIKTFSVAGTFAQVLHKRIA